jgi:hypothetical protein
MKNYKRKTPIYNFYFLASIRGQTETVNLLIDFGARTKEKDSNGQTALHLGI